MPQCLVPSQIDLSDASHPNIRVHGKIWALPDQIDGYDYETSTNPFINLGNDTIICEGSEIILTPGGQYESYCWQDGSTNSEFLVKDTGTYWVEVTAVGGCVARDSVFIIVALLPDINLGNDTTLNDYETLELDAGPGFISYLWKDGSTGRFYEATRQAYYWVTVSDGICEASDTILITYNDCEANLVIPNCFTPNGDGYNERFNVESGNLSRFSMLIFNRWGQLLFETEDINKGWDGKVNGRICPVGTYYYLINYTYECDSGIELNGNKKGSVTLLE